MFLRGKDLSPDEKVLDKDGHAISDFMILVYPHVTRRFYNGRYKSVIKITGVLMKTNKQELPGC